MERYTKHSDEADFRDRANEFVAKIEALTKKYSSVISTDFENTTQSIIDTSPKSAKLFKSVGMNEEAKQILNEGHQADIESTFQNIVNLKAWSGSDLTLSGFLNEVEQSARKLGGKKEDEILFTDNGEDAIEDQRFEAERSFKFS